MLTPCLAAKPDRMYCSALVENGGRCAQCKTIWHKQQTRNGVRKAKKRRLYTPEHKQLRARFVEAQQAGHILRCWVCGRSLGKNWDLDHEAFRIHGESRPACTRCNRGQHGKKVR